MQAEVRLVEPLLIDISRLLDRAAKGRLPTGVDRVMLAYLERWGDRSLAILQKGNWRRVLGPVHSQQLFALLRQRPERFAQRMNRVVAKACLPPWPRQQWPGAWALHLGQTGLENPGFVPWVRHSGQKPVFFVHDLIPLTHPEYCRVGEGVHHQQRLRTMLHCAAAVVANSAQTLADFERYAAGLGLPVPPGVVAPLAPADLGQGALQVPPLQDPYFVVLGTIEPRKNHLLLLNVWRELAQQLGPRCPKLVVVGQRGWECEQVVDMLERCHAIHPHVLEVPCCTDQELATWLRHARALLFPSFAEGFGMPLVEALALGTPVVASRLPVFQEVAGDTPDYLSPIDGAGWMQAVHDYLPLGSARRQAQCQRMAGFAVPTWEDHFQKVESLLERL